MFDLYLAKGCRQMIDNSIHNEILVSETIPRFRILRIEGDPIFLGLNMDHAVAHQLLREFKRCGGLGLVVETKYRQPLVNIDQATRIAVNHLMKEQQAYPNIHFGSIHFNGRTGHPGTHPMWWTFSCFGQEWVDAGRVPGKISAYIDKVDGSVWSYEAVGAFHESQE